MFKGVVTTFAGSRYDCSNADGLGTSAALGGSINRLAADSSGSLYFFSSDPYQMRKVLSAGIHLDLILLYCTILE